MLTNKIIRLNPNPKGFGDNADELTQDMFVSSLPVQHSHSYYENDELGLYVGVWDTTDMIETAAPYGCDEFMTIIEGAVEIKNNKTGKIETVMAGESFVIPKGYDCQWRQQGYLRKFYVISEHPAESIPKAPSINGIVYIASSDIASNSKAFIDTHDGHSKKELYVDHLQRFSTGIWRAKALTTALSPYPDNEFLLINKGDLICLDKDNIEHKFKQGDALFIPQGAICAWRVEDNVTITYVKIKAKK